MKKLKKAIIAIVVVVIVLGILSISGIFDQTEDVQIVTESNLHKIIEVSQLSTYECVYNDICTVMDEDDSSKVKIEHYVARNEENELEYKNLLAVCKGNDTEPFEKQTCDTRKGKEEININPQKNSDILNISYTSNGEIKSSNSDYQKDFDDTLNLNDVFGLVKARKEALNSLKRSLSKSKTHLTEDTIRRIYTRYSEAEIKESYVGILLWYLQKKMR